MNRMTSYHWCNHCKEQSVRIKCYTNKQGERKRVMYCLNKGCGWNMDITIPQAHDSKPDEVKGKGILNVRVM